MAVAGVGCNTSSPKPDGGGPDGGGPDGGGPDGGASVCLPWPSIVGDLEPQWSSALGEGNAGGMKLDAQGNLIVVGSGFGALTVGGETFTGPTNSTNHPFVLALDPNGKVLWQRIFNDNWTPTDFALDGAGDIYVAGTQGSYVPSPADLGTGPISGPAILAKLDSQGNTIWSHGLQDFLDPAANEVLPLVLAVDPTGQIAIAGGVYGAVARTSFLAWYDASGAYAGSVLPPSGTAPASVAFDAAGNLVVAGSFQGTLGLGQPLTSLNGSAFATKMDAAHNVLWSLALGEFTGMDAVATDGSRTFLAGTFSGSLTLGGATVVSQGLSDIYVATIDDGAPPSTSLLARYPAGNDHLDALAPDGSGGLWAAGEIADFVDFGTGPIAPVSDVVLHLDGTGRTATSAAFPLLGGGPLSPRSVAADAQGDAYLFGTFDGAIDLGGGVVGPTDNAFDSDVFLVKLSPGSAALSVRSCPPPAGALLGTGGSILPTLMALAGPTLAFTTGTETMTVPIAGGAPTILATAQKHTVGLSVAGPTIFWANAGTPSLGGPGNDGSIVSVPLAGGTPTVLAEGQSTPVAIAADDNNVYWTTAGVQSGVTTTTPNGAVWLVPIGGGTPSMLASGLAYVGPIAVAGGVVVFAAGASSQGMQIMKAAPGGGGAVSLASAEQTVIVTAVAIDGTAVYWTEADSPSIDASNNDGLLRRVTLDGGTILAHQQPGPFDLALVGDTLDWCNSGGFDNGGSENSAGVWSISATGGAATAIVSALPTIGSCTADAAHVAWTAFDGNGDWKLIVQAR